jgi:hypothetical protein
VTVPATISARAAFSFGRMEDSMGSGRAGKGMGNESTGGHRAGAPDGRWPDESDLASEAQDYDQLQGNDQRKGRNQRGHMPGETTRTEGVVESFERMDPKKRA